MIAGWIALVVACLLAFVCIDRHATWTRIARNAAERARTAARLLKRPNYQVPHAVGEKLQREAVALASEIPEWCRRRYLEVADEQLQDDVEEERRLADETVRDVRRSRRGKR